MTNLPSNVEAEKIVINALLQRKEVKDINHLIDEKYYFDEVHKLIIGGIKKLYEENLPFETALIDDKISTSPIYTSKKVNDYLSFLKEKTFDVAEYQPYLKILINKHILREKLKVYSNAQLAIIEGKPQYQKILEECEREIFELSKQRPEIKKLSKASTLIDSILEQAFIRGKNPGKMLGIPTGYDKIDDMMLGLQKTDFNIVAARANNGKSAFLTSVVANNLVESLNHNILIFSLEMSEEQIIQRIVSGISKVELWKIRTGKLDVQEWARVIFAQRLIRNSNIIIDDTPGLTANQLRTKTKSVKSEYPIDILFVDYLQLMSSGRKAETRALEVSQISRDMKILAKEEHIPVIALSQLSRAVDKRANGDKKPQLSDLKESSSLEQDPDNIMFIYREYLHDQKPELENLAEIIIAKQRNGPLGSIYLGFLGAFTKFENLHYEKSE